MFRLKEEIKELKAQNDLLGRKLSDKENELDEWKKKGLKKKKKKTRFSRAN